MVAYLLIIIAAFTVVTLMVVQLVGEYLFSQRMREEERIATELATQLSPLMEQYDAAGMYELAASVGSQAGARVLVLDKLGTVQVDSESLLNGRALPIREVASVLSGAAGDSGYYRADLAEQVFRSSVKGAMTGFCTCPIVSGAQLTGVVVYLSGAQEIYEGLISVVERVALVLALVFVVVGVLSAIIMRLFIHPLDDLNEGISRMSKGDFTTRVRVSGKNEFAELAQAFNTMSQRMEMLDRSRNQFVSNASHELKTPLATMKILLQTLLYQEVYDPDISHEFLTDIDKEIDRLSNVVSDLLTLVSIDSGEMRMKTGPLSLRDLMAENVRRLLPLARERGIEMEFSGRENVEVIGDNGKLTQVFYNLIDNAIKYTPRGGHVLVELTRQGKIAIARVTDNGIGIPKEDQMHIFDRFYRVDKARSRETGGTGLGLSIVKQIILMHEGSIAVASRENEGTTFTVELPVAAKAPGGKNA